MHSATKFIGGHGTSLGGIIIDSGKFDWKASGKFPQLTAPDPSYHGLCFTEAAGHAAYVTRIRAVLLRDTGAAISPFNAFLLLQGLENTFSSGTGRMSSNALRVAAFLDRHPKVKRVNHPSLPGHPDHGRYQRYFPPWQRHLYHPHRRGQEEAHRFIDRLQIFLPAGQRSRLEVARHPPASTTHTQLSTAGAGNSGNLPGNAVRLSIGTEHIDDLLADLNRHWRPYLMKISY